MTTIDRQSSNLARGGETTPQHVDFLLERLARIPPRRLAVALIDGLSVVCALSFLLWFTVFMHGGR
ncbi:hypothetical protein EYW49_15930 [Siculibacillus lacustris]|uniref:Uncharacterized protein n=1 Tax=Siculibacillus lacustris TaxID=1549641 RepID=A0A4Q9VJK2_9HYPH|nr:hypothetical protein [Siculibacillus lacustris]TBW35514.1 hypothetical protein EYW49_15930 [Siculibacillus lacustris]